MSIVYVLSICDCGDCDDCPIAKFFKGEVDLLGLFSLLAKCKKD